MSGGGLSASEGKAELGKYITLVGLGIQLVSFSLYAITLVLFGVRVYVLWASFHLSSGAIQLTLIFASICAENPASLPFGQPPTLPVKALSSRSGGQTLARTGRPSTLPSSRLPSESWLVLDTPSLPSFSPIAPSTFSS
jgi:hypothetical protein